MYSSKKLFLVALTSLSTGIAMAGNESNTPIIKEKEKPTFERKLDGFLARIDCDNRSVAYIKSEIPPINTGEKPYTLTPIVLDNEIPLSCQQKSTKPYPYEAMNLLKFTRGELISSSLFTGSTQQNRPRYAYNTIPRPQLKESADAWTQIDERLACLRTENYPNSKNTLTIISGVIWNDYGKYGAIEKEAYIDEFGIKIPKALWKIAIKKNGSMTDLNAWIIPNHFPVDANKLNNYLVTPEQIAIESGQPNILNLVPSDLHSYRPIYGFALSQNCK